MRQHPREGTVQDLWVAAVRIDGRVLFIRMMLAPPHTKPDWQAYLVMGLRRPQKVEILIVSDELFERAAAEDLRRSKLFFDRWPYVWILY